MILALLFSSLVVIDTACGVDAGRCVGADDLETIISTVASDPKQLSFDLRDLTGFGWSRLDAFGEYSPVERVKARTGLSYRASWWQDIHVKESHTLLVFSQGDGSACYVEVKNANAQGATWSFGPSIFQELGIPAATARFIINRTHMPPVLELRNEAR